MHDLDSQLEALSQCEPKSGDGTVICDQQENSMCGAETTTSDVYVAPIINVAPKSNVALKSNVAPKSNVTPKRNVTDSSYATHSRNDILNCNVGSGEQRNGELDKACFQDNQMCNTVSQTGSHFRNEDATEVLNLEKKGNVEFTAENITSWYKQEFDIPNAQVLEINQMIDYYSSNLVQTMS